jgi:hypothetical protein
MLIVEAVRGDDDGNDLCGKGVISLPPGERPSVRVLQAFAGRIIFQRLKTP